MIETFDFSEALKRLKEGKTVARAGWHVMGSELELVKDIGAQESEPYFVLRMPEVLQPGWNPWVADLLAEDWYEVGA